MGRFLKKLQPFFAVILGLMAGLLVTAIAGENPWHVLQILTKSAFGTWYDFGMTLFYATPLVFTGLSVAIAFHAGLFNIGGEGQLVFGALGVAAFGALFPGLPWPVAPIVGILIAFLSGALWGAIPGWLRAKRGSHEVINTIMLNFVAAGISSYVTLYLLKNTEGQNPETLPIGSGYMLSHFAIFGDAPVSTAILLAFVVSFLVWVLLWKTVLGFEIRAVGKNEIAAKAAGIDASKIRILAMSLAGGVAGLVGVVEVMGNAGKFRLGFSPDYGFIGIAVALLGRNRPLGILGAALLFGALHKGTAALDFETENVTREVSLILEALVILAVSADGLWDFLHRNPKTKIQRNSV